MDWTIRRASLRDKRALARLCKAAVGSNDYVLDVLGDTILNETILVALDYDGSIIGMMSYRQSIDGCGWLGMMRTHPDFQRKGVARALIIKALSLAHSSRAQSLRFWSDYDNVAANAVAKNSGFKAAGEFVRMNATAIKGMTKAKKLSFGENLWRLVEQSSIIKEGNGFLCHDWCFVPATRTVLFELSVKGTLRGWEENLISFLPEKDRFTNSLEVTPLTGRLGELLTESRFQARRHGCTRVSAFIPNNKGLIDTAKKAGFQIGHWGIVANLYELPLKRATSHHRV